MAGWALSYAVSTRWAAKLVVAAAVALVPVCAARFARHVGASPLAALVVAPMALGWLFSWGLVANLVGLTALLAVLPVLDRLSDDPTPRRALGAVGGAVLLYFAHEAMLFLYGAAALGLAPPAPRVRPAGGAALGALCRRRGHGDRAGALAEAPAHARRSRAAHAVASALAQAEARPLPPHARRGSRGPRRDGAALPARHGLVRWLRSRERRMGPTPEGLRGWAKAYRWEMFAVACFAAYLAFPLILHGATLVYQRWFPPGFAVLAVVLAPRDLWVRSGLVARIAVAALPLATLLVAWPAFADASQAHEALATLLPYVETGSAVVAIDLGPGVGARNYSLGAASGRVLATRGGRLVHSFADSPISPVLLAPAYQWNESFLRVGFDPWGLRPQHDLRRIATC
jgi:hypothetical protein